LGVFSYTGDMNIRKIVKKVIPRGLFRQIEPMGHGAEAALWAARYGFPARDLHIIGITGTDGKTTTATLLYRSLQAAGVRAALLSTATIDLLDGKGERANPTHMTTASSRSLMQMLRAVRAGRPEWVVLEISSHALAQHRALSVPFEIGIITNLSHEHLDYHGTMERYAAAKRRLFERVARHTRGLGVGISNADDPLVMDFASVTPHPVTYGIEQGDLRARKLELAAGKSVFMAESPQGKLKITSQLTGRFNVYNTLAVVATLRAIGLDSKTIQRAVAQAEPPTGRMMRVDAGQAYNVIIDYAVTPAAIESALTALREIVPGKLSIVFGATGDRDRAKRPVMGAVVVKHADRVYLTDDEPYTEDAGKIRAAVMAGIKKSSGTKKTKEFANRAEAIRAALKDAKKGDAVLITGLGHQTDRNVGGKLVPWSDEAIVRASLKK
jgi:UDP-N-acetylmuramoyl-L-alanyl-D-glutamate--2,6-diaminopimelate ligase